MAFEQELAKQMLQLSGQQNVDPFTRGAAAFLGVRGLKQAEAIEKQRENIKRDTLAKALLGDSFTPEQQALASTLPTDVLQKQVARKLFPERQDLITVKEGDTLFDPTSGTATFTAPLGQETQFDLARKQRELELKEEDLGLKRQEAASKIEQRGIEKVREQKKLAVPGFKLTGDIIPTPAEVTDFRKATAATKNMQKALSKIEGIIDKIGAESTPDQLTEKAKQLSRIIQLEAKGPELFNLGVLAGPDLDLLEEIIPADPTSVIGSFRTFDNREALKGRFAAFKELVNDRLENKASALGYKSEKQQKLGNVKSKYGLD